MAETPSLLRFLLKYRIWVAALVNATLFGLLRGQMNMWFAALIAASCFGLVNSFPLDWEERLKKNSNAAMTSDSNANST